MRVLGHIHTFNDEEIIERSLNALRSQTHPIEEVVLVDNASKDGTLKRAFPPNVTLIRHLENRGTSGAVVTGFQYAIDQGYDWIWIFDADSLPRKDALEKLLELYESFPEEIRSRVSTLASLPLEYGNKAPRYGWVFRDNGCIWTPSRPDQRFYECDVTVWSGSLFNIAAVKAIGMPCADYVLDWGEAEYAYRGKKAGYKTFVSMESIMEHDVHGRNTPYIVRRIGPIPIRIVDVPPLRLYYFVRNTTYFWLYEFKEPRILKILLPRLWKNAKMAANALLMPSNRWASFTACIRGFWDGVWKNMRRRY